MCRLEIKQQGTAPFSQVGTSAIWQAGFRCVQCRSSAVPTHPAPLPIPPTGFPVLLCGQFASEMSAAAALRNMLRVAAMPVVTTFQARVWCGVGALWCGGAG